MSTDTSLQIHLCILSTEVNSQEAFVKLRRKTGHCTLTSFNLEDCLVSLCYLLKHYN